MAGACGPSRSRASRPFVGYVGLWPADYVTGDPMVEVGWRLAHEHWGHGYVTEAAREALRFGFEACGLDEIVSFTVPQNDRSRRVMERIGLHPRAVTRLRSPQRGCRGVSADRPAGVLRAAPGRLAGDRYALIAPTMICSSRSRTAGCTTPAASSSASASSR